MVDLQTILAGHRSKRKDVDLTVTSSIDSSDSRVVQSFTSEIPDVFFDSILIHFKLTRIEIMVLMYLYRQVWCKPNLHKVYGISQLLSYTEMAKLLNLELDEIYHALRKIEEYSFISTIRSGQYFVRKFFTKENDEKFSDHIGNHPFFISS